MSVDDYREALPPATPLRGGEYALEDELGRGGFAITYAALDTELGRQAALKEFFPPGCGRDGLRVTVPAPLQEEFARARDAFAQEARALARFSHPHIVGVYATWSENETAYLALERIRGETLLARLERVGALPQTEVLAIAHQIGDALQVVHEAGLLHRDVTPGNIMLEPGDDALHTGRAVLLDFGLALESEAGVNTRALTRARAVGTPGYAAPEQWGRRPKTPAIDVYALAATLYHALSGTAPPPASDRAAGEELEPLAEFDPALAPWDDALTRGMALSVVHRLASVSDLLARLPHLDALRDGTITPDAFAPVVSVPPHLLDANAYTVPQTPIAYAPTAYVAHPGYESPRWAGALVGVAGRARDVAWSPDGQRVAVASDSRLLWVWSPNLSRFERRARARTIAAHTDWLRSVAWSPDGRYLVSGGADKTLRLWSSEFEYAPDTLEMGCEVSSLEWQVRPNTLFDPARGLTLGVGGSDGRTRLLRLANNELSREPIMLPGGSTPRYHGDAIWIRGIGWAEDGARLWSSGDDGMLRAWESGTGVGQGTATQGTLPMQTAAEFMAHPGGVRALAVSANGNQLATVGGYDALVKIWDSEGRLQRTLSGARGPLLAVTWIAPDVVAAGGRDRAVRLWDTQTGAQLAILPEHPAEVCCLAFSPVAPYLCAGSEREVWVWRL